MSKSSPLKIIVAMPAYNEAKYIGSIILQAKQYADEVIVVDDGSADQTSLVAELAGAVVIRHRENMGYGRAIQSIFNEVRNRNADVLVILDADAQHNPDEIPSLIRAVHEGSDLVIGSRELQKNLIPFYRRVGQRLLSNLTYIVSRKRLYDTESGFRAYSKKAVAMLELKEEGMAASAEIVSVAARQGLQITEVPISVTYSKDSSSMNPVKHGFSVLNRILIMISEKRPLLFFGVGGSASIILGVVAGIVVVRALITSQVLNVGTALISMLLVTVGVLTIFTGVILDLIARRMR